MNTLEELLWLVNDSTVVEICSAETFDVIATYDGKDSIPEKYNDCEIADVFVSDNKLCIEIKMED